MAVWFNCEGKGWVFCLSLISGIYLFQYKIKDRQAVLEKWTARKKGEVRKLQSYPSGPPFHDTGRVCSILPGGLAGSWLLWVAKWELPQCSLALSLPLLSTSERVCAPHLCGHGCKGARGLPVGLWAVSWRHQMTHRNHEQLLLSPGSAGVGCGAHVDTLIVLESAELQQSWETSIAIRAGPKVGTHLLWVILIAFFGSVLIKQ